MSGTSQLASFWDRVVDFAASPTGQKVGIAAAAVTASYLVYKLYSLFKKPPYIAHEYTQQVKPVVLSEQEQKQILADLTKVIAKGVEDIQLKCPPNPNCKNLLAGGSPTIYLGSAGIAMAFLQLYHSQCPTVHGNKGLLEAAGKYIQAADASRKGTQTEEKREHSARPRYVTTIGDGGVSFHFDGGVPAVRAQWFHENGDQENTQLCVEEYLQSYLSALNDSLFNPSKPAAAVAESATDVPPCMGDFLSMGRGGYLFGISYLSRKLRPTDTKDADADDGGKKALLSEEALTELVGRIIDSGRHGASSHAHVFAASSTPSSLVPLTPVSDVLAPPLFYPAALDRIIDRMKPMVMSCMPLLARPIFAMMLPIMKRMAQKHWKYNIGIGTGQVGVLYSLLYYPEILKKNESWAKDVVASVRHVLAHVDQDGSCFAVLDNTETRDINTKSFVQWCRGSPAAMYLAMRAYEVFELPEFLTTAERLANHVFQYGLMRKGNGLCHGTAGNAYAFLTLYRLTNNEEYYHRALYLAREMTSAAVNKQQRTPDHPYSLFEGLAGTLCFYADLFDPKSARFPGMEV